MSLIVSVFYVMSAVTLILVVLLQAGKDSGLAGAFGAGSAGASDSVFGAQSNNFLNKFTSVMAFLFLTTALVLALISSRENRSLVMKADSLVTEVVPVAPLDVVDTAKAMGKKVIEVPAVTAEKVAILTEVDEATVEKTAVVAEKALG
jgi:preprotein translocase subunit SecG